MYVCVYECMHIPIYLRLHLADVNQITPTVRDATGFGLWSVVACLSFSLPIKSRQGNGTVVIRQHGRITSHSLAQSVRRVAQRVGARMSCQTKLIAVLPTPQIPVADVQINITIAIRISAAAPCLKLA